MSMKLFDVASMEDYTPGFETKVDIIDVVAMGDRAYDLDLASNEVTGLIHAMESSVEAADMLANQIAIEESILDAGNATYGIAQLATISLQNTAALVGINPERFAISNESMEANPTTALRVSVESANETFKAIVEKIKAFFSRVWSSIKKMTGNLMLAVTDYEKKFKALSEKVDNLKDEKKEGVKDNFTEAEGKKVVLKNFAGAIKPDVIGQFELVTKNDIFDTIGSYFGTNDVSKGIPQIATPTGAKMFLGAMANAYNGIPSIMVDNGALIVSRTDGDRIKGELIKTSDIELRDGGKYSKIEITSFSATAKKEVVDSKSKSVKIHTIAEIKKLIEIGSDLAKAKKEIVDNVDGVLKKVEAALGKAKEATGSDTDKAADKAMLDKAHGTNLSRLSTGALRHSSDILLGYVANMKNLAYVAQLAMSKYKTKEA